MTTKSSPALEVQNVSVRLGGSAILNDINFTVGKGEFVGIIGPNGAGKSTLLKSLRGLIPLSSGHVSVFGHLIHSLGDKNAARLVAYMQQEINVGFGFTAFEIVLAGRYPYLKWWCNETEHDRRIAQKYMEFTGTWELADKPVNQVSGGERQRILLAKVLAQETPLVFLDEPTASLDLVYQEEIFRYCQAICAEGKSVLIVAHDIRLAAKFCSRLILVADGRIIADGDPAGVITVQNLKRAYGLHSAVFVNKITGNLDIHTYIPAGDDKKRLDMHVIGGGGSTGGIIRHLYECGYNLTAGVLQAGDSDADVAAAFGIDFVQGQAFSEITPCQAKQNRQKIASADMVVLGNIFFGRQNIDNLKAAFEAARLFVIEDSPIERRDFTGGEAVKLYEQLVKKPTVRVMSSRQFLDEFCARKNLAGSVEEKIDEC